MPIVVPVERLPVWIVACHEDPSFAYRRLGDVAAKETAFERGLDRTPRVSCRLKVMLVRGLHGGKESKVGQPSHNAGI